MVVREDADAPRRLVAYLAADGPEDDVTGEVRELLKAEVASYMVPAAFVVLDALPRTASGKVERRALPAPTGGRRLDEEIVLPRTAVEETLAALWRTFLRLEHVGIHDNFFELGGDSILSLRLVARAAQKGLRLTPRQVFEHPTIAELASVASRRGTIEADQGPVSGVVSLTPIQRRFFATDPTAPHHFNQALMLTARRSPRPALLEEALRQLIRHHDALRTRFTAEPGKVRAMVDPTPAQDRLLTRVDLSALSEDHGAKSQAFAQATALAQTSLNLEQGALCRALWLDLGSGGSWRLLLVIHHLVVDGVSWRLLVEDLETLYGQLERKEVPELPPKTTRSSSGPKRLERHATSGALDGELAFWTAPARSRVLPLPVDFDAEANTLGVRPNRFSPAQRGRNRRAPAPGAVRLPHPDQRPPADGRGRGIHPLDRLIRPVGGPGRPWSGRDLRQRRPDPHGGLVHHDLPRAAGAGPGGGSGAKT